MYVCIYIYIYIERERERERDMSPWGFYFACATMQLWNYACFMEL